MSAERADLVPVSLRSIVAGLHGRLQEPALELIEAVLTEERFAVVHHQRHAVMPADQLCFLVRLDNHVQAISILIRCTRERRPVHTGGFGGML